MAKANALLIKKSEFLRLRSEPATLMNKKFQSLSSSWKISSTFILKYFEIFKAKTVDGTYLPASKALTVCLETPILFANSSCVIFKIALSRNYH